MYSSLKNCLMLLLCLGLACNHVIKGQSQGNNQSQNNNQTQDFNQYDLSTINVDQLTDDQIQAIISKANQSGMTFDQLENLAIQRGMPADEVEKLKDRIDSIQSGQGNTDSEKFIDRSRSYKQENEDKVTNRNQFLNRNKKPGLNENENLSKTDIFGSLVNGRKKERPEDKIFGFSIFNNKKFTFEPGLNIPTPRNYQLGPGDDIVIDIWGASQQTFQQKVSPDGAIFISNLGPVFISGMSIEEAIGKLKKDLSNIYAGLQGANPNTFLKVSLKSVRSIKVNILGEAYLPGTYTLPSLASVFNALYAAGGPSMNGTLRNIKVVREGKKIAELDFYDYLLKGELKNNLILQDQDVVFISPYSDRVEIIGEVKRPAYYDLKETENLKNLLSFAGGTSGKAYTQRYKVLRKTGRDNKVFDIPSVLSDTMKLVNGDRVIVDSVIDRFENRVEIKGAVYRPGIFALDTGLTLKKLIEKADGLRGDAFTSRISIYRTRENLTMSVIPVDLGDLINDKNGDIPLKREDLVFIPSIFDLKEEYTVNIDGEIRKPGSYSFVSGGSVEDLILRAGGLLESASLARLEIARRIKNNLANNSSNKVAEIYQYPISSDLKLSDSASKFILQPFDQVFIRRSPGYEVQEMVNIAGEVAFPGTYIINDKEEKLSDLINRAGGLSKDAYVKGARLVRKLPVDKKQRLEALRAIASHSKDSVKIDYSLNDETTIGIYLDKILSNPGSNYDLILQTGDSVIIPKELQTVRLSGAVLFPVTVRFDKVYSFKSYINRAGGFAPEAQYGKSYIIYANGSIDRTHKLLFFNLFPRVEPGAEIVVPKKPVKKGLSPAETVGITSAIATMALVIVEIITALK